MSSPRFPIHFRMTDGHSAYRITSETTFTEVQRIGRRYLVHRIVAHTWPERLRIADMLANPDGALSSITEAEFDDWLGRASKVRPAEP